MVVYMQYILDNNLIRFTIDVPILLLYNIALGVT